MAERRASSNLDRLKQALWDAFHGTAQPTTLEGLKLHLDEVGWQVETAGRPGYRGRENVPVTDEVTQAAIYGQLIREAACDPDVASLSFFGYRDDGLRTGFQAGLARADGSARPSAAAVQEAIAASTCAGELRVWSPGIEVLGTKVAVGGQVDGGHDPGRGRRGCARERVRAVGGSCCSRVSAADPSPSPGCASLNVVAPSAGGDDASGRGDGAVRRRGESHAAHDRRASGAAPALTLA